MGFQRSKCSKENTIDRDQSLGRGSQQARHAHEVTLQIDDTEVLLGAAHVDDWVHILIERTSKAVSEVDRTTSHQDKERTSRFNPEAMSCACLIFFIISVVVTCESQIAQAPTCQIPSLIGKWLLHA